MTESLLRIVLAKAEELRADAVFSVDLVVGERTGYVGDSIQFYFDRYAKGTVAEGAVLNVHYVKPLLRCPACGTEFERSPYSFACPSCGADGVPATQGGECYVQSIELERPAEGSDE